MRRGPVRDEVVAYRAPVTEGGRTGAWKGSARWMNGAKAAGQTGLLPGRGWDVGDPGGGIRAAIRDTVAGWGIRRPRNGRTGREGGTRRRRTR